MLRGKTAIITGGSRGIGRAAAHRLASMGANIAVIYSRDGAAAEAVCRDCAREYGVRTAAYCCDVADFSQTKQTVAAVRAEFGAVQILVNNAGITRDGLIAVLREEDYDAVLDVNLKGAFHMIRHCTGLFLRAGEGCIINISSVSGLMGNVGQSSYAASKAGLIGLTKSVARELAPKGIRCNAVAPGFIRTDMTRAQGENPLCGQIPLGRMGTPEEVADAVAYLATAAYVTGTVLRVDGGIAM
ncbi:MAG: 3-oxoacyl-ACP reductase FabG [Butyricicoccaceae bacterium]